jgi:hypothetical protein
MESNKKILVPTKESSQNISPMHTSVEKLKITKDDPLQHQKLALMRSLNFQKYFMTSGSKKEL